MRVTVEDGTGKKVVIDGGTAPTGTQWDGTGVAGRLVKAEAAKRFTLCVAYPALRPDAQIAADGFRDVASKEAVEDAAHSYLLKHRKVGLWHAPGDATVGSGDVVESYIWRADPWVVKAVDGTQQTVYPGDWMLGVRWTEKTWPLIVSGEVQGLSMQGGATRRKPSRELLDQIRR
jgi:Putative phage serine protease XkdF